MPAEYIVVFVTCKDEIEAKKISESLLRERLVACVNGIPKVHSLFWWEGKIDQADEVLLVLKSEFRLLPEIIEHVKKNHSYSVPEVIALAVVGGNPDYLQWLRTELKK